MTSPIVVPPARNQAGTSKRIDDYLGFQRRLRRGTREPGAEILGREASNAPNRPAVRVMFGDATSVEARAILIVTSHLEHAGHIVRWVRYKPRRPRRSTWREAGCLVQK